MTAYCVNDVCPHLGIASVCKRERMRRGGLSDSPHEVIPRDQQYPKRPDRDRHALDRDSVRL